MTIDANNVKRIIKNHSNMTVFLTGTLDSRHLNRASKILIKLGFIPYIPFNGSNDETFYPHGEKLWESRYQMIQYCDAICYCNPDVPFNKKKYHYDIEFEMANLLGKPIIRSIPDLYPLVLDILLPEEEGETG